MAGNSWDVPTGIGHTIGNFFRGLGPAARDRWNNFRNQVTNPSLGNLTRAANQALQGPTAIAGQIAWDAARNALGQRSFDILRNNQNSLATYQGQAPNSWLGNGAQQNPTYPTATTSSMLGQSLGIPNYLSGPSSNQGGNANSYLTGNFSSSELAGEPTPSYAPDYAQGPSTATPTAPTQSSGGHSQGAQPTGRTWSTISMSDLENMLGAGLGRGGHVLMPRHEIGEDRARARALGMTLTELRNSGQ